LLPVYQNNSITFARELRLINIIFNPRYYENRMERF
jgi:hypothetical protein